jgi:hypothetical protein
MGGIMSLEAASALKPDVYRVTAIVLVPGFVAAAPWVAGVFWPQIQSPMTWKEATLPISLTAFGIVLVVGFFLEDIGSRVEVAWADRWLRRRAKRLSGLWWTYLAQRTDSEIIAQRYLRSTLLRFKFELSMIPASILCATGLLVAQAMGNGLGWVKSGSLAATLVLLSSYCMYEVRSTSVLLAKVRRTVIRSCSV